MKKQSKYRNVKSGGYDSLKEKRRADLLKILQKNGNISELQEQVKYELIPSQYEAKICIERACSYYADFVYRDEKGELVVEDTKGVRTPDYIIKRKLMLQIHNIKIKEV